MKKPTLYCKNRQEWRKWLEKNHNKKKVIWLIYYKKHSNKPRIPYNDAVEEAICFGWIDSTVNAIDKDSFMQRFSPRNPKSNWSELNKERARRMIKEGRMTKYGLEKLNGTHEKKYKLSKEVLKELKKDKETWQNFQKFPEHYKTIRVAWIDDAKEIPEMYKKRLSYFLKKTKKNERFGMLEE